MAKRRGRSRKGSYKLTARRRVALKKAQAISARNRSRNGSGRKYNTAAMGGRKRKSNLGRNIALTTVGVGAITAGGIVARHKLSGSNFSRVDHPIKSKTMGNLSGSRSASLSKGALGGGRAQVSFHSKKKGPLGDSFTFSYNHEPLKRSDVLGSRLNGKVVSYMTKRRNRRLAKEHMIGGVKPYNGPRKYIGTKEMFTEIGANGKVINKGYTSMGNALSGRKG